MVTRYGTLSANTVATVTLPARKFGKIEVINRSGEAEIFFLVLADGRSGDPTVGGDNCELLPAAIGALEINAPDPAPVSVKLISTGTPDYGIRAE